MDLEKIGKFIAQMRKEKHLTQQELANKLGVTDRAVSNWENGRRMPDISLYKTLCNELGISVNELVNGEIITNKVTENSIDKTIINTLDYGEKNKHKLNKIIKILLLVVIILITFIALSLYSYRRKYPKIDIYRIDIFKDEERNLVNQLIVKNVNISYYALKNVLLCDASDNCYNMMSAIEHGQTNINKIKKYLDKQVEANYLKKFNIYDSSITIYKNNVYDSKSNINEDKQYEVIMCNNTGEIYFGIKHMESELQGKYCGIIEDNIKKFIRTYKIISITPDNNEEYLNVTLEQFQYDVAIVKIPRKFNIQIGKNYEFTFSTYETFDDTIENIFKYASIEEVNMTNKLGLEQIQEPIYINHKN